MNEKATKRRGREKAVKSKINKSDGMQKYNTKKSTQTGPHSEGNNIQILSRKIREEKRNKMADAPYRCEAENIDSPTTEPRRARIKAPPPLPPLPPLLKPPVTEKAVSDRPSFESISLRRSSASASSLRRWHAHTEMRARKIEKK